MGIVPLSITHSIKKKIEFCVPGYTISETSGIGWCQVTILETSGMGRCCLDYIS